MIAPLDGPKLVPESAWIAIQGTWGLTIHPTGGRMARRCTSPPAGMGTSCLSAQRLAAGSHRPVGEPFPVQHFHGRVHLYARSVVGRGRPNLATPVLAEDAGSIWVMSRPGAR